MITYVLKKVMQVLYTIYGGFEMPGIARMIVKDELDVYRVISRTAPDGVYWLKKLETMGKECDHFSRGSLR